MEELIPVINKLQDIQSNCGLPNEISLPQIVVVGSQSTGKSSVIESIVRKDFLPRGRGIVTRRPLILQLIYTPDCPENAEFLHIPNQKFYDFEQVRQEIQKETERLLGNNKGISPQPISLTIRSPHVVNLSLVDLPGLTRIPVGDQPSDIEERIREMVLTYISNPNSLILAISSADVDLANSDALRIAREVDPEGDRTLGVITKIDKLQEGENALDSLEGRLFRLKLGYIGVICRSQADIDNAKPLKQHLEDEQTFFSNHTDYAAYADKMGVKFLTNRLNSLLVKHIKETLPELKKKVNEMLQEAEKELLNYGMPIENNPETQRFTLLQIIQDYCKIFSENICGSSVENITEELRGGSRLKYFFFTMFRSVLDNIKPLGDNSELEIRTAIENAKGLRNCLFVPEKGFEMLVVKEISKLKQPCHWCLKLTYDELKLLNNSIEMPELQRFTNLRSSIVSVFNEVLDKYFAPAQDMIDNVLHIEISYINIQHPDLISPSLAMQKAEEEVSNSKKQQEDEPIVKEPSPRNKGWFSWLSKGPQKDSENSYRSKEPKNHKNTSKITVNENPCDKELIEFKLIKELVESYFSIVKKNIGDVVPKVIMNFLVNKVQEKLQTELVKQLYKKQNLESLLQEAGDIPQKRRRCMDRLEVLQKAYEILNEVRDYQY